MNMASQQKTGVLIIFLIVTIGTVNAAAPIQTVSQGNTVFIGEQGLDIHRSAGRSFPDWMVGVRCGSCYKFSGPDVFCFQPDKFFCCTFNLWILYRKLVPT